MDKQAPFLEFEISSVKIDVRNPTCSAQEVEEGTPGHREIFEKIVERSEIYREFIGKEKKILVPVQLFSKRVSTFKLHKNSIKICSSERSFHPGMNVLKLPKTMFWEHCQKHRVNFYADISDPVKGGH